MVPDRPRERTASRIRGRIASRVRERIPAAARGWIPTPVRGRVLASFGGFPSLHERIPGQVREYLVALASLARVWQFASVGAVGAVCENVVLAALVELGLLAPVPGAVLAKELSIALMFALNEVWTFSGATGPGAGGIGRRFLTSNLVRGGGAAVGVGVLYALHAWLGAWYLLANVAGIGVGFALNYVAEALVTWRVHRG